jgi:hypothetical protein
MSRKKGVAAEIYDKSAIEAFLEKKSTEFLLQRGPSLRICRAVLGTRSDSFGVVRCRHEEGQVRGEGEGAVETRRERDRCRCCTVARSTGRPRSHAMYYINLDV